MKRNKKLVDLLVLSFLMSVPVFAFDFPFTSHDYGHITSTYETEYRIGVTLFLLPERDKSNHAGVTTADGITVENQF